MFAYHIEKQYYFLSSLIENTHLLSKHNYFIPSVSFIIYEKRLEVSPKPFW